MHRFLILALMIWLLMLLPFSILLQRLIQAEQNTLIWTSLAAAPAVAWFAWQAISVPLPKTRFAVLQWLGFGYALGLALLVVTPLLFFSVDHTVLSAVTVLLWFSIFGYGLYCALMPKVVHVKIQSPLLKRSWRAVQISDVHVGSRSGKFLQKVVAQVNQQEADLVFITGDLVDGSDVTRDDLCALYDLSPPSYMITGNHERYIDMERVLADIQSHGVTVLRNQSVEHEELRLIGVDDEEPQDQVAQQLTRLKPDSDTFNILLYHKPDGWQHAIDHHVALMLSGHTHGGQIWPFMYGVKKRHPEYLGLYSQQDNHLYVNQGTGTWGPIFRFGTRGEITVFELSPTAPN